MTLGLALAIPACHGQAARKQEHKALPPKLEETLGRLEEIAMCHHAIKAAEYDASWLGQNPYYRYVINSPRAGSDENAYPIPQRCKSLETDWMASYLEMDGDGKALADELTMSQVGLKISDIASDAEFFTVVVNKMTIEGSHAADWANADKDIPQDTNDHH